MPLDKGGQDEAEEKHLSKSPSLQPALANERPHLEGSVRGTPPHTAQGKPEAQGADR